MGYVHIRTLFYSKTSMAAQCNGKNSYSKNGAERAKAWVGKGRDKAMRIYKCNKCFMYHLTKRDAPREARPEKDYD